MRMCSHTQAKKKVIVNKYVLQAFPHLHMVLKKFDIRDVFPQNMGTPACILIKAPEWQGNAVAFPALITIVLGNA
jgi:hypothetical protein